jgi:hypothetical protein
VTLGQGDGGATSEKKKYASKNGITLTNGLTQDYQTPPHIQHPTCIDNKIYLIGCQEERVKAEEKFQQDLRDRFGVSESVEDRRRLGKGQSIAGAASLAVPQGAPKDGERHAPRRIRSHVVLQLLHGPDVVEHELSHQHVGAEGSVVRHGFVWVFFVSKEKVTKNYSNERKKFP